MKINTCIVKGRQSIWSQSCFYLLEFLIIKRERFWPYLYFDEWEGAFIRWAMQSVSQHFWPKPRGINLLAEFLDNQQRSLIGIAGWYLWALAFRDSICEITWVLEQLERNRGGKSMSSYKWPVLGRSNWWAKVSIKAQFTGLFRPFLSLITDKWTQWSLPELDVHNCLSPVSSDLIWSPLFLQKAPASACPAAFCHLPYSNLAQSGE